MRRSSSSTSSFAHKAEEEARVAKSGSAVRVVVRIRPLLRHEAGQDVCIRVRERPDPVSMPSSSMQDEKQPIHLHVSRDFSDPRGAHMGYVFDHCYFEESSQEELFSEVVGDVIGSAFSGFNVTVMCYGNTGSGKTFTMQGPPHDPGIIPRTLQHILSLRDFKLREFEASLQTSLGRKPLDQEMPSFRITMSFVEIYNEKLRDMMHIESDDLPIRHDRQGNIVVAGLKEIEVKSENEFYEAYAAGCENRVVAGTKLNVESSRSHAIVIFKIQFFDPANPKQLLTGRINCVDLAGSEDNRRTGNKDMRMTESIHINKSLHVLGKVVNALNCKEKLVPYRDSKLTRLLQDSLGGSSLSVLICNVSPGVESFPDTQNTLNFATKSRQIVNTPVAQLIRIDEAEIRAQLGLEPTEEEQNAGAEKQTVMDFLLNAARSIPSGRKLGGNDVLRIHKELENIGQLFIDEKEAEISALRHQYEDQIAALTDRIHHLETELQSAKSVSVLLSPEISVPISAHAAPIPMPLVSAEEIRNDSTVVSVQKVIEQQSDTAADQRERQIVESQKRVKAWRNAVILPLSEHNQLDHRTALKKAASEIALECRRLQGRETEIQEYLRSPLNPFALQLCRWEDEGKLFQNRLFSMQYPPHGWSVEENPVNLSVQFSTDLGASVVALYVILDRPHTLSEWIDFYIDAQQNELRDLAIHRTVFQIPVSKALPSSFGFSSPSESAEADSPSERSLLENEVIGTEVTRSMYVPMGDDLWRFVRIDYTTETPINGHFGPSLSAVQYMLSTVVGPVLASDGSDRVVYIGMDVSGTFPAQQAQLYHPMFEKMISSLRYQSPSSIASELLSLAGHSSK